MQWDWSIDDGWTILVGSLCAVAASLLGNFLVLRRLSLIGDAISHSVLPGIVAAFLFSGQRSSFVVLLGAGAMGLITVGMIQWIQRYGKVEESAAIGVVFTTLFAIGLVMMVRAGDKTDLDPSCVLYGNLETICLDTIETPLGTVPRVTLTLGCVCLLNVFAILLFYKQWQISTFDPLLSQAQGIPAGLFHYVLSFLVAVTCIASFEAVGNILVVAMLVVPASTALLLCNRLSAMIATSVVMAVLSAILGHGLAIYVPVAFGFRAVNLAAMMSVASGLLFACTIFLSPKAGLLTKWFTQRKLARRILGEDVVALLYRYSERSTSVSAPEELAWSPNADSMAKRLTISPTTFRSIALELVRQGWVRWTDSTLALTDEGRRVAQNLVRSHRLWEQHLATEMHVSDARLHEIAESLEHFTSPSMRGKLDEETGQSTLDPHGRSIPPEI